MPFLGEQELKLLSYVGPVTEVRIKVKQYKKTFEKIATF